MQIPNKKVMIGLSDSIPLNALVYLDSALIHRRRSSNKELRASGILDDSCDTIKLESLRLQSTPRMIESCLREPRHTQNAMRIRETTDTRRSDHEMARRWFDKISRAVGSSSANFRLGAIYHISDTAAAIWSP